jgi:hypothetical protein
LSFFAVPVKIVQRFFTYSVSPGKMMLEFFIEHTIDHHVGGERQNVTEI